MPGEPQALRRRRRALAPGRRSGGCSGWRRSQTARIRGVSAEHGHVDPWARPERSDHGKHDRRQDRRPPSASRCAGSSSLWWRARSNPRATAVGERAPARARPQCCRSLGTGGGGRISSELRGSPARHQASRHPAHRRQLRAGCAWRARVWLRCPGLGLNSKLLMRRNCRGPDVASGFESGASSGFRRRDGLLSRPSASPGSRPRLRSAVRRRKPARERHPSASSNGKPRLLRWCRRWTTHDGGQTVPAARGRSGRYGVVVVPAVMGSSVWPALLRGVQVSPRRAIATARVTPSASSARSCARSVRTAA